MVDNHRSLGPPGSDRPTVTDLIETVRTKQFTPTRLREGYSMEEVDEFCDTLTAQLDDLQYPSPLVPPHAVDEAPIPVVVETSTDASLAAVRTIEVAARLAEQVEAEAKQHADTLVAEAKAAVDVMRAESQKQMAQAESDARGRVSRLDDEVREKRAAMMGDLERQRDELMKEVDYLQRVEAEHRSRFRDELTAALAAVGGAGELPRPRTR